MHKRKGKDDGISKFGRNHKRNEPFWENYGTDYSESRIPVDQVIDAMREIGDAMPMQYKETACGGCAATEWAKQAEGNMRDEFVKQHSQKNILRKPMVTVHR